MRYFCHSCNEEVEGREGLSEESESECGACGSNFIELVGQDVETFLIPTHQSRTQQSYLSPSQQTQPSTPAPSTSVRTSTFHTPPPTSVSPAVLFQFGGPFQLGGADLLSLLLRGTGLGERTNDGGAGTGGLDDILHQLFMNHQHNSATPTTPEIIASLRREREVKTLEGLGECGITLEPFEPSDVALIMPCNHAFKEEAILQWLATHNTCPGIGLLVWFKCKFC